MVNQTKAAWLCAALVLALPLTGMAQPKTPERLSFIPADSLKGGPGSQGRYEVIINRWSSEAEQESLQEALEIGHDQLQTALASQFVVGYIHWPGALQYILRYAHRIARPDGSEDIVLATDRPMTLWWWDSPKTTETAQQAFTVIQLRLNKAGGGQGTLSVTGKVGADTSAKSLVIGDFAAQPSLLTDVRREAPQTSN
jgi:hypothetical protein